MINRKKGPKWSAQARCGIYLGPSPRHTRNVALVLSLDTEMVSPQFHVAYNTFFEMARKGKSQVDRLMPTKSKLQAKCEFVEDAEQPVAENPTKGVTFNLLPDSRTKRHLRQEYESVSSL